MFSSCQSTPALRVGAQHIVYGSLPARGRGYELLGRSPLCAANLVAEVIAACRRYGQPPSAAASRPAWFALRLSAGQWAVVTVDPQGDDDQGRPGALIFDAVVVPAEEMAATGFHVAAFRSRGKTAQWPEVAIPATLAGLCFDVKPLHSGGITATAPGASAEDARVQAIVAAITKRQRVALEAEGPIDDLVAAVWARLPERVRRRSSVATWTFSAENQFDLMAVPRLAGVALDPSYLAPAALDSPADDAAPRAVAGRATPDLARRFATAPRSVAVGVGGMILVVALAVAWAAQIRERDRLIPPASTAEPAGPAADPPGDRTELSPATRAQVARGLRDLAERFAAADLGEPDDATAFLSRFADRLHYHGPLLSEAELARLRSAAAVSPDAARAVRWHEQIQLYRDDQPWPARFADLALRDQLQVLARSFRLDPSTPPEGLADALIRHLARSEAIGPNPLGADFPAIGSYARFLARLPRRDEPDDPPQSSR